MHGSDRTSAYRRRSGIARGLRRLAGRGRPATHRARPTDPARPVRRARRRPGYKRTFPDELWTAGRADRRGPADHGDRRHPALRPDLVVLDEFQRFKDLLRPDPTTSPPSSPTACSTTSSPRPAARPGRCSCRRPRTGCTRPPTRPTATTTRTSSRRARSCSATGARPTAAGRFGGCAARSPPTVARAGRGDLRRHRVGPPLGDGPNRAARRHAGSRRNAR